VTWPNPDRPASPHRRDRKGGHLSGAFSGAPGVTDTLYLGSRDPAKLGTVLHNARVCALLREAGTRVEPLRSTSSTRARRQRCCGDSARPSSVNSAALLSLYPFFPALRKRQKRLGSWPDSATPCPRMWRFCGP